MRHRRRKAIAIAGTPAGGTDMGGGQPSLDLDKNSNRVDIPLMAGRLDRTLPHDQVDSISPFNVRDPPSVQATSFRSPQQMTEYVPQDLQDDQGRRNPQLPISSFN